MKRTFLTLLAFFLLLAGVSAQYYTINYRKEDGPHYEFQKQTGYKRDPNDDDETYKRKRDEFFKNNTRVLIKSDPIE